MTARMRAGLLMAVPAAFAPQLVGANEIYDDSDSFSVVLTTTAPEVCILSEASPAQVIEIEIANDQAEPIETQVQQQFNAYCNYGGTEISLASTNSGLTNLAAVGDLPDGFLNKVDYQAQVTWVGSGSNFANAVLITGENANNLNGSFSVERPISGPITFQITTIEQTGVLVSGLYEDVITVQFGAVAP